MSDDEETSEPYKAEISKLLDLAKFAMLCCILCWGYLYATSLGLV